MSFGLRRAGLDRTAALVLRTCPAQICGQISANIGKKWLIGGAVQGL
jgi:hypothetical protein